MLGMGLKGIGPTAKSRTIGLALSDLTLVSTVLVRATPFVTGHDLLDYGFPFKGTMGPDQTFTKKHMGMCFFDVALPGGWYKGYESRVWFGVWLGGMIRGMARAPLNSCFVALDTAKLPCAGNWIAVRLWTA